MAKKNGFTMSVRSGGTTVNEPKPETGKPASPPKKDPVKQGGK